MPFSEAYGALEKGVIDGVNLDWGVIPSLFKGIDFYFTEANLFSVSYYLTMNMKKWKSLPPDIQQAIESVRGEKGAVLMARAYDSTFGSGKKWCQANGLEFNTLSAEEKKKWVQACKPLWDAWLKRVNDRGLPGEKILARAQELLEELTK
jgi:TRAP-type C4-dicarboxylate transport system substrate-binding protein